MEVEVLVQQVAAAAERKPINPWTVEVAQESVPRMKASTAS